MQRDDKQNCISLSFILPHKTQAVCTLLTDSCTYILTYFSENFKSFFQQNIEFFCQIWYNYGIKLNKKHINDTSGAMHINLITVTMYYDFMFAYRLVFFCAKKENYYATKQI